MLVRKPLTAAMWHARMGHPCYAAMIEWIRRVRGVQVTAADIEMASQEQANLRCAICVLTKRWQKNKRNKDNTVKIHVNANERLDRIYMGMSSHRVNYMIASDIAGPYEKSMGGHAYFILTIDIYSRKLFAKLLKNKAEGGEAILQAIKKMKEQHSEDSVCIHFSDMGGEFMTIELATAMKNMGITAEFIAPGSSWANGIVERAVGTVKNATRAMVTQSRLSPRVWGEALTYYVECLYPLMSHRGKLGQLPACAWDSNIIMPDVSDIRTFGCQCYAKKVFTGPLSKRSLICRLMRTVYDEQYRFLGYRLLNVMTNRIIFTRDVEFSEKVFSNDLHSISEIIIDGVKRDHNFDYEQICDPMVEESLKLFVEEVDESSEREEYWEEEMEMNRTYGVEVKNSSEAREIRQKGDQVVELLRTRQQERRANDARIRDMANKRDAIDRQIAEDIMRLAAQRDRLADIAAQKQSEADILGSVTINDEAKVTSIVIATEFAYTMSATLQDPMSKMLINPEGFKSVSHVNYVNPKNIIEARKLPDWEEWRQAIEKELTGVSAHLEMVKRLPGMRVMKSVTTLNYKFDNEGNLKGRKARYNVCGYDQRAELGDFTSTYAPTIRAASLKYLLYVIAVHRMPYVAHADCTQAYLNAPIDAIVFVEQPKGYDIDPTKSREEYVYRILSAHYGTRQAGHLWHKHLNDTLVTSIGMKRMRSDNCIYVLERNDEKYVMGLFVDDIIKASTSERLWNEVNTALNNKYKMTDKPLTHYLGMKITYDMNKGIIMLSQKAYIEEMMETLKVRKVQVSTPISTSFVASLDDGSQKLAPGNIYRKALGMFSHPSHWTRPDLAQAASLFGRFSHSPTELHLKGLMRAIAYANCTKGMVMQLGGDYGPNHPEAFKLTAWHDAAHADCLDTRRSTQGGIIKIGPNQGEGGVIEYYSKRQRTAYTGTFGAEYTSSATMAGSIASIQQLSYEMQMGYYKEPTILYGDNEAAGLMASEMRNCARMKNIDIRYHIIQDYVVERRIELRSCKSEDNWADIFTKPLPHAVFVLQRSMSGLSEDRDHDVH